MVDRKPSSASKSFELVGSLAGIGGLILLLTGFALEGIWSTVAKIVGIIGVVVGLSLVAIGNLMRDWD